MPTEEAARAVHQTALAQDSSSSTGLGRGLPRGPPLDDVAQRTRQTVWEAALTHQAGQRRAARRRIIGADVSIPVRLWGLLKDVQADGKRRAAGAGQPEAMREPGMHHRPEQQGADALRAPRVAGRTRSRAKMAALSDTRYPSPRRLAGHPHVAQRLAE